MESERKWPSLLNTAMTMTLDWIGLDWTGLDWTGLDYKQTYPRIARNIQAFSSC